MGGVSTEKFLTNTVLLCCESDRNKGGTNEVEHGGGDGIKCIGPVLEGHATEAEGRDLTIGDSLLPGLEQ